MIEIEESILIKDAAFTTEYLYSSEINVSQNEALDFFIYLTDTNSNLISYVDCVIEYTGKFFPDEDDWCRVSVESYDNNSKVYNIIDYIARKEILKPTSFSVRCRSQGRLMRLGVKANTSGGNVSIGVLKKKRI